MSELDKTIEELEAEVSNVEAEENTPGRYLRGCQ